MTCGQCRSDMTFAGCYWVGDYVAGGTPKAVRGLDQHTPTPSAVRNGRDLWICTIVRS